MCARILIRLHSVLFSLYLLLSLAACDGHGGSTGSGPVSGEIAGRVYQTSRGAGFPNVAIYINSAEMADSIFTDAEGQYTLSSLPEGTYSIRPVRYLQQFLPAETRIEVNDSGRSTAFFFSTPFLSSSSIAGVVTNENGSPIPGVTVTAEPDSGGFSAHSVTSALGFYTLPGTPGIRYRIAPSRPGYSYTFSPPEYILTPGDSTVLRHFTARNTGMQLHAVSGQVINERGKGLYGVRVILFENNRLIASGYTDLTGYYRFSELKEGDYTLSFQVNGYSFTPGEMNARVDGKDVSLSNVTAANIMTVYTLRGKIVDSDNAGVSGVRFGNRAYPGDSFSIQYSVADTLTVFLIPEKEGYGFSPERKILSLAFVPGIEDSTITIPDFIATDYTIYTPTGYFPLSASSSRTYSRTTNLLPTADYSISASGTLTRNGQTYRTLTPSGPAGFTAYRVEGNSVYTLLDNAAAELLRFGTVPGTSWTIGKAGGMYPLTGTFVGLETVTVPAGMFPDCLKFTVRKEYGSTTHETYTLWFAKDVGMVRSEKVTVNYGEERERVVDTLQ